MSEEPKRRRWPLVVSVIILAAVLIFAAPHLVSRLAARYEPGEATGAPLDIRYIGVIPNLGADLYDASGARAGECLGIDSNWIDTEPGSITMSPLFAFEVPGGADNLVMARSYRHRYAGQGEEDWQGHGFANGRLEHPIEGRYFLHARLFKKYWRGPRIRWWPWLFGFGRPGERKLTDIDLALSFWHGARGEAAFTFEGPFEEGQRRSADAEVQCVLTVSDSAARARQGYATIEVDVTGEDSAQMEVLFYDANGSRHYPYSRSSDHTANRYHRLYALERMPLAEIAFITVGEKPRERVFHNVAVWREEWADIFAEYHAAIKERAGDRVGGGGPYINFHTPQAALDAVDLLRGSHITETFRNCLLSGRRWEAEALDDQTRARALGAARNWLTAWDPRIRAAGAGLGALISFEDFRSEVFSGLESEDGRVRVLLARVLRRVGAGTLGGPDMEEIARILRRAPAQETHGGLMAVIRESPLGEAGEAMRSFALYDRTRFWCHGLADERAVAALGPFEKWPDALKARRYIAMGREARAASPDEGLAAAAAAILPGLVTPELAAVDHMAFIRMVEALEDLCEKRIVIAALVDFLRGAWNDGQCSGGIILAVGRINALAGVNIAHISPDFNHEFQPDWSQAARDAVEWYETGAVPLDIPEGYRAKAGDLRIVRLDTQDGEKSAAGLYMSRGPDTKSRQQVIEFPGGLFAFQIWESLRRTQSGTQPLYHITFSYALGEGRSARRGMSGRYVEGKEVPGDLDSGSAYRVRLEPADSPESVLSGTKVFADWWEKYGPLPAGDTPTGSAEKAAE